MINDAPQLPQLVSPSRRKLNLYGMMMTALRQKLNGTLEQRSIGQPLLQAGPIISISEKNSNTFKALIKSSHERPMDLNTSIPWHLEPNKLLPPKKLDQLWISGTRFEVGLTEAQRLEIAWLETARDCSMFIQFEQQLPRLYMGYINDYEGRLPPEVTEYLMVFSKEEIVHSMAFKRYMKAANLPFFVLSKKRFELLASLRHLHPCVGILVTLIIEWSAEQIAIHGTQFDGLDPLTRELFKQHHLDEVRHIGFACRIVEEYFKSESESVLRPIRRMLKEVIIPTTLQETCFNADIAKFTSFKFPVQPEDVDAIQEIRFSEHNRQLNAIRFKDLFEWYQKLGLM
jgi:P-aminobenzoate N-oxygenase AurF